MRREDLIEFLGKFDLDEEIIKQFLDGKELVDKNGNVFLSDKKFDENQVFDDGMIFIQLNEFLPTTFLLDFIAQNSTCVQVKSQKQAMNYTYGKSLSFDSTIKTVLVNSKCYVVKFEDSIIGYCQVDKKQKVPILNKMNVGEYLKES